MLKVKSLIVEVIAAIFIGLMIPLIFMRQMEDMKYLRVQPLSWSGEKYVEFLEIMAQFHAEMTMSLIEMTISLFSKDHSAGVVFLVYEFGKFVFLNWINIMRGRTYAVAPNIISLMGIVLTILARKSLDGKILLGVFAIASAIFHLILYFSFGGSLS